MTIDKATRDRLRRDAIALADAERKCHIGRPMMDGRMRSNRGAGG